MASTTKNETDSLKLWLRLWSYLRQYVGIFLISIAAMLIANGAQLAFVRLLKPLVDEVIVKKQFSKIDYIIPSILGLFLLQGVMTLLNSYATVRLSSHLIQTLRQEIFGKLLRLPVSFYETHPSGRLISRVTNDVKSITDAGFNVITVTVKDGVLVLGCLVYLFLIDWQLTLLCFIVFPAVALCVRYLKRRMRRLSRENQKQMGGLTQILNEDVKCHRVVKIYNGESAEETRFMKVANRIRGNQVKTRVASAINTSSTQLLISIALCIGLYFAAYRANQNALTAGQFVQFITAMTFVFDPMKRITNIAQTLQKGLAGAESVFNFLDEESEPDRGTKELGRATGAISLRHVSFRYQTANKDALSDVSLDVKPGETLALVGVSGSGKTTLVSLIPRFYLPTEGEISLDGIPLNDIKLSSLREQIALVSQDVVLFNDSVANNIAYGSSHRASREEIEAASKAANASEFIEQLPEGFDTQIGENGVRLSGGQRQRLAIARALLKNAPILVLDEATSALDTHSERLVQAALENLMKNRTTIVIAHRLSTIENADRIAVMSKGKIVELGDHRSLLAQGGIYAKLHALQFKQAE